jgi:hypothetical protein
MVSHLDANMICVCVITTNSRVFPGFFSIYEGDFRKSLALFFTLEWGPIHQISVFQRFRDVSATNHFGHSLYLISMELKIVWEPWVVCTGKEFKPSCKSLSSYTDIRSARRITTDSIEFLCVSKIYDTNWECS